MDVVLYENIMDTIRQFRGLTVHCGRHLQQKFPNVNLHTLGSILSIDCQRKMKQKMRFHLPPEKYYEEFREGVARGDEPGVLLRMSLKYGLAPTLLARLVVRHFLTSREENADEPSTKQTCNKMVVDTTLIEDAELAHEVFLCTTFDDQYSPTTDVIKLALGQEYEQRLHRELTALGLTFRDEQHLRRCGYDKTPDVKLEVPVAVDGFVVNWVESKALFADEETHKTYLREQYLSYWNRFGPGLVIYWFGFLRSVQEVPDKRLIVRDCFPKSVVTIGNTCLPKS